MTENSHPLFIYVGQESRYCFFLVFLQIKMAILLPNKKIAIYYGKILDIIVASIFVQHILYPPDKLPQTIAHHFLGCQFWRHRLSGNS